MTHSNKGGNSKNEEHPQGFSPPQGSTAGRRENSKKRSID